MLPSQTSSPRQTGRTILFVFALGVASLPGLARAESWAERLGFPADKKVILLHTREMGLCHAANAADEALWQQGLKHSSAAMTPCPWFADYVDVAQQQPHADVGLTLTLNSEWPRYRWQPLARDENVTSLVDQRGYLWPTLRQTVVTADLSEVETELHAQILHAQLSGLRPTHLTTHLGTLYSRADFAEAYLKLAHGYWIPAVVIDLTPEQIERFRRLGLALPNELIQAMDAYPLPKLDDLQFAPPGESFDERKAALLQLIDDVQSGLVSIDFHPAVDEPALARVVDDAQQRIWDLQLLTDQQVTARLKQDDIVLTTWSEVMARYEGQSLDHEQAAADSAADSGEPQ